ncbi:hypothetical protein D3C76_1139590 [compost metagenome]
MTDFETRIPVLVELGAQVGAQATDGVVGVGGLAETLEGVHVEAPVRVVVLAATTAVEQVEAGLYFVTEVVAQAQVERLVAIGVMVAIAWVGGVAPVDTGAFIEAGAEIEAGILVAARKAEAALPGLIAACGQAQAWLQTLLGTAAGEDLDDTADSVAAVDRRT